MEGAVVFLTRLILDTLVGNLLHKIIRVDELNKLINYKLLNPILARPLFFCICVSCAPCKCNNSTQDHFCRYRYPPS